MFLGSQAASAPPFQAFKIALTGMNPVICAVKPQAVTVLCHLPDVSAAEGGSIVEPDANANSNELHTRHPNLFTKLKL